MYSNISAYFFIIKLYQFVDYSAEYVLTWP